MSLQFLCFREIIFRVRLDVWNLNRTPLQQCATHRGSPPRADWRACPELQATWRGIVNSGGTATVAIVAENHAVLGTANAHGILQQRLKDALEVEHGSADGLEYLGRGSLLPQRFTQFLGARLHLVEQAHVLDRDQRLVGESGDELDLPVRERLDVIALETDDGDHYAVAQQRNPEHRAIAADLLGLQHVVLGISQAIRQVNRFSLNRGSADQRAASRSYRMLKEVFDIVSPDVVGPHQVVFAVLQLEEKGMFRLAQARRCLQDGINYWLQLVGRARNDVEHVTDRSLIVERFLDLARARLHLVEQPHVLNGDDRLVGEGGDEVNLLVGERAHVEADQNERADRDALAQHGNSKHGAIPHPGRVESVVRIGIHIGDVNSTTFEQGASGGTTALWRDRQVSPAFHGFGGEAVAFGAVEHAIDLPGNGAHVGVA